MDELGKQKGDDTGKESEGREKTCRTLTLNGLIKDSHGAQPRDSSSPPDRG